jgi:hypothetical protein
VLEQVALGGAHLQVDLAARLLEQPRALGGGGGGDALLLGGDLRPAAGAEGVELPGQCLHLLLELGQLRGGHRLQLRRLDQVLAHLRLARSEVLRGRLPAVAVEDARQDDEVGNRPEQAREPAAVCRFLTMTFGGLALVRRGAPGVFALRRRGGRLRVGGGGRQYRRDGDGGEVAP